MRDMSSRMNNHINIIFDLTCFYTYEDLKDSISFMEKLVERIKKAVENEYRHSKTYRVRLIIPTIIYRLIHEERPSKGLLETLNEYLREYDTSKVIPEEPSRRYFGLLREIKKDYELMPCSEFYDPNEDKLGENSITIQDFIRELGERIGKVTFEILVVAHKIKGIIISTGTAIKERIEKMKIGLLLLTSKIKEELKKKAGINRKLVIIFALTKLKNILSSDRNSLKELLLGNYSEIHAVLIIDIIMDLLTASVDALFIYLNG